MRDARVITDWTASYTPALCVRAGEKLSFGGTDPDNPGWRWARNAVGLGGWLPTARILGDHLTCDFDSAELTITAGEQVHILETMADWHLCETHGGCTGWLPASHLDAAAPR